MLILKPRKGHEKCVGYRTPTCALPNRALSDYFHSVKYSAKNTIFVDSSCIVYLNIISYVGFKRIRFQLQNDPWR